MDSEIDKKAMYKLESEALYNEICRLALEETNWTFEKEYNDCKVYRTYTPVSEYCPCFKLEFTLEMSPERINDSLNPFGPYRKECDQSLFSSKVLEEISDNAVIGYKVYHTTYLGIIETMADDINVMMFGKNEKFYYNMSKHIEYEGFEETNGYRICSFPCGNLIFETEDPNVSRVIFLYQIDPKAPWMVPQMVIDTITVSNLLTFVDNLKAMKDKPYERLGPDVVFCKDRISDSI